MVGQGPVLRLALGILVASLVYPLGQAGPGTPSDGPAPATNSTLAACVTLDANNREVTLNDDPKILEISPPSAATSNSSTPFFEASNLNTGAKIAFRSGLAAYADEKPADAADFFWTALKADPTYTMAYYNFWKSYQLTLTGKTAEAKTSELNQKMDSIKTLARTQPQNPHFYWLISFFEGELGNREGQNQQLQQALALDANFAPAQLELAQLNDQAGNSTQAEKLLRSALLNARNYWLPFFYFIGRPPFGGISPDVADNIIEQSKTQKPAELLTDPKDDPFGGEKIARLALLYLLQTQRYSGQQFLASNYKHILDLSQLLLDNYPKSYWSDLALQLQAITYYLSQQPEKTLEIFRKASATGEDWLEKKVWAFFSLIFAGAFLLEHQTTEAYPLFYETMDHLPIQLGIPQETWVIDQFLRLDTLRDSSVLASEVLFGEGALKLTAEDYTGAFNAFALGYKQALAANNEVGRLEAATNLAVVYLAGFGNQAMAIRAFREVVRQAPNLNPAEYRPGSENQLEFQIFIRAAGWLLKLEDYSCSFAALDFALKQLEDHQAESDPALWPVQLDLYLQLGSFWYSVGNLETAETFFQKGRDFASQKSLKVNQRLEIGNWLAKVYLAKSKQSGNKAPWLEKADNMADEVLSFAPNSVTDYDATVQGDAWATKARVKLYGTSPDLAAAQNYLDKAKAAYPPDTQTKVEKLDRPEILELNFELHLAGGFWSNASNDANEMIEFGEKTRQNDVLDTRWLAQAYFMRGLALEKAALWNEDQPDPQLLDLSKKAYQKAVDYILAIFNQGLNIEDLRQSFLYDNNEPFNRLIAHLFREGAIQQAFKVAEQAKVLIRNQTLGANRFKGLEATDPALLKEISELSATITAEQNSGVNPAALKDQLARLDQLTARVKQSPQAALASGLEVAEPAQIQAQIPADAVAISYYLSPEATYVWIISKTNFTAHSLKLSSLNLQGRIENWHRILAQSFGNNTDKVEVVKEVSAGLYQDLFSEQIKSELGQANRIIVSPHGFLNYIPFQALFNAQTAQYLVEKYAISYTPSLTELITILNRPAATPTGGVLVVNPTGVVNGLNELKASDEKVAELFNATTLYGAEATVEHVLQLSHGQQIIQLSTHGYPIEGIPQQSYLEFAGTGSEKTTHLTVLDLSNLDLTGTRLVVLSACNTIPEKELNTGNEVNNLNLTFLEAGSSSVVYSLWEVNDRSTGQLQEAFYRWLKTGVGRDEALRQAQLEILKQKASPYYWAAFNLTGDSSPLAVPVVEDSPSNRLGKLGWLVALSLVGVIPPLVYLSRKRKSQLP